MRAADRSYSSKAETPRLPADNDTICIHFMIHKHAFGLYVGKGGGKRKDYVSQRVATVTGGL